MKLKNLFKTSLKKKILLILNSKNTREEVFEEVEEQLILSDISVDLVDQILNNIRKKSKLTFEKENFLNLLNEEIKGVFDSINSLGQREGESFDPILQDQGRKIILVVGINGSGKTTSVAKLANYYRRAGKKVLMAAADTFRAAGGSQLSLWGEKLGIPVVCGERGADPGSVVYNSISSFNSKEYDLLIIDTAGRVQSRENLMKELEKLVKIVKKFYPHGPAETLLVIDATMGQNTRDQAKKFKEFSGISGILLAKIDGSAKGGTILNIVDEMRIPVRFIGTGETENDLAPFSVEDFLSSLLSD